MPTEQAFGGTNCMFIAVLAATSAGALWGLTFVAPLMVAPYSPFDLAIVRYVVFGLASFAVLAAGGFEAFRKLRRGDVLLLAALGFTGNLGYYVAMSLAVPLAGSALVALIIGCLPVVMSVLGNRGADLLPFRRLVLPLACVALGLALTNLSALSAAQEAHSVHRVLAGLGLTLVALALWTWYGLRNASAIVERPTLSAAEWTALTGVGVLLTLLPAVLVGVISGLSNWQVLSPTWRHLQPLLAWGTILGLLSSWVATWAWSFAARRLPVSLAAQLIVSETVFALIYAAIHDRRWPGFGRAAGAAVLLIGVTLAIRAFHRRDLAQEDLGPGSVERASAPVA